MNPADYVPGSMPARQTEIVPAPQGYEIAETYQDAPVAGKRISVKMVGRALRRHWWQALIVWIVASVGLMAVAYVKVKPTYSAFARVRVEPAERAIFNPTDNNSEFGVYKETQVNTITSPVVLETALAKHPELALLPRLSQSDDKISEMRAAVNVMIVPKTNHIDISMTSESMLDSTAIVNAVVEAYLLNASDSNNKETEQKIKRLEDARQDKSREVDLKRTALRQLTSKLGAINVTEIKGRTTVSVEQYSQLSSQLLDVQLEVMKAETRLAHLQSEQPPMPTTAEGAQSGQVTEQQISEMFYNHPSVVETKAKLDRADDRYRALKVNIRDLSDPSLTSPLKAKRDAQARLDALWTQLRPTIEAQIRAGATRPGGGGGPDPMLREAEIQVSSLKLQESSLAEKLSTLNIKQKEEGVDAIALEFERLDLARAEKYLDTIEANLAQIKFENRNPLARVRLEFTAKPSSRASTSNRLKIMAMAPVGVLFGVLSLLVLLELHAGRVVDPEDLLSRVRVPVIGVVPPLPQIRSSGAIVSSREEVRAQRQLDQYVQSLDHLRVALCSGRNAWGRERRCILITSAIAAEGKTTLAAQLAERCINAGLHTLLIDGDLRNPTLTRMFDLPTNLGLINVLRGETLAKDAMAVVGGAGGFSFMPAGSPRVDPSRLLHGERLGKLIGEVRQEFDIVIVDAPPVLPVPDALTIGRWCDGAVLAVRYDMSRFPLVEKANRRLATVGVSVIGAVVNGVRLADSAYGSYYPSYGESNQRASQSPLDV
jgi:succinoglycan biosynthesis transport protein ExoP